MKLAWPRAERILLSMGTDVDLTKATRVAIQEMTISSHRRRSGQAPGYKLTSMAGDVGSPSGRRDNGRPCEDAKSIFRVQVQRVQWVQEFIGSGIRASRGGCSSKPNPRRGHQETGGPADAALPSAWRHSAHHGGIVMMTARSLRSGVDKGGSTASVQRCGAEDLPASVEATS